MATKAEGIWECVVIDGKAGETDKGTLNVQVNIEITAGPSKGMRGTYEDEVNAKSALYIGRSLRAIGWQGASLKTLADDIAKWVAATGGKTTAEVKHIEIKKGKAYDKWLDGGRQGPAPVWDKINSLGRGPQALKQASASSLSDADEAMRRAMADDGIAPPSEPTDDQIPF